MKNNVKRMVAVVLAVVLIQGLAACDGANAPKQEATLSTEAVQSQPNRGKCTELGTPLADLRVRQALLAAIDLDTIIEALLYDSGEKAEAFGLPGTTPDGAALEYNPEKAKELLAEAGWPSEYVLDVVYCDDDPLTVDVLNVIGSYWEAVGVKAQFRKLEGDVAAQLWTAPEDPHKDDSAVEWDLAFDAVMPLTESEYYSGFASHASHNSHTPPQEGLDEGIEAGDYDRVRQLLAEYVLAIPLYHQDCYLYTSDHIGSATAGNDRFAYEKDILNWTTDREDNTLYTNGGPVEFYCDPVENPGLYLYQELIFERLVNADGQLNPTEGALAESYTVSDDGLTVEFILREDAMWQDGQPLTAEDVKFTFELYMRCPDTNSLLSGLLNKLVGAGAFIDWKEETCTGITVEENKVTFVFEEVAADALTVFSQWPVLPKHCLEFADPETLQQHRFWKEPIGSGPYRVAETVMGEYALLERWEEYRRIGEGNIDRIYMAASGETDADLALRADRDMLDYAWGASPDDAASVGQMEGMQVTPMQAPYLRCFYINQFPHESYYGAAEITE